jgi:Ni,Fe-hydrogenase I cytochrome b subunit
MAIAMTTYGWWTVAHGFVLGVLFLLAFASCLMNLGTLGHNWPPPELEQRLRRLKMWVWIVALSTWLMVITGTYISYVPYRAASAASPKSKVLAAANTAWLHNFAMEWKEHIAWAAPLFATAVVFIVACYGAQLATRNDLRRAAMVFLFLSFVSSIIGSVLGFLIYKAVPIL